MVILDWTSPLITVTHRPHHPSIAAGLYCLTTSPGLLPALCEKWSGFFYVHRVLLSYTRDRRLKVSSERLGNEDKAPCPRTLLPGWGSNRGPPGWTSEVLTARPRQLLITYMWDYGISLLDIAQGRIQDFHLGGGAGNAKDLCPHLHYKRGAELTLGRGPASL